MWIAYLVLAIVAGAILGIAGAGFLAVPVVLALLAVAAFVFMRQSADTAVGGEQPAPEPREVPQDTDHAATHAAHRRRASGPGAHGPGPAQLTAASHVE